MIKGGNPQEMFDGMPDQFYHFLASTSRSTSSTTTTTTSIPLSFSLHHHHHHHHGGGSFPTSYPPPQVPPPPPPPSFDSPPFPLSPPPHLLQQPQLFPFDNNLQQATSSLAKHHQDNKQGIIVSDQPWSNDEVLALLRIRSCVDTTNWFPHDFTWENVSRKLGELGFKRSAEKCKEKFEEETRSFNNNIIINNCNNKNIITNNYRLFGELEDLYNSNSDHHHRHETPPPPSLPPSHEEADGQDLATSSPQSNKKSQSPISGQNEEEQIVEGEEDKTMQDNEKSQSLKDSQETEENTKSVIRKRKRHKKFEMLKGFCEGIVDKMMSQQEELHCKILQDMVKRDEEKFAKEEAWKKKESERIHKEMEVRALELAIAGDRQAKLLDILNKFTSSNSLDVQSFGEALEDLSKVTNAQSSSCFATYDDDENPTSLVNQTCIIEMPTSSLNENIPCQSSSRVENSKLAPPKSSSSQNPNALTSTESYHTSTDTTNHNIDFRSNGNQASVKPIVESKIKDDIGRRWPRDEVLALINIRCSLLNSNIGDHTQHDNKGPLWERISQKMLEVGYKRSAKRCKEKWENINKYFRKTKDLNKKRSIDSRTCPYYHQLSHLYSQGTFVEGGSTASNSANTTTIDASQDNQEGLVQAPSFDFEF